MQMIKTELAREPLTIDRHEDYDDFGKRCADKLGYNLLAKDVNKAQEHQIIKEVFDSLAFAPLRADLVAKYKDARDRRNYHKNENVTGFCGLALGLTLVSLAFCGGDYLLAETSKAGLPALIFFISVVLAAIVFLAAKPFFTLTLGYWQSNTLKEYHRTVPKFALQTALEIGQRLDERGFKSYYFQVEWLSESNTTDPFLVLNTDDGNRYYLEVWEEPGFDVQREI
jgi:hypothetical protein